MAKSEALEAIEAALIVPEGYEEYDLGDGYGYLIKRAGSHGAECRFCRTAHEGTVSHGVQHWNSCAPYVAYVRSRGCLGLDHQTALRVAAMVTLDLVPRHQLKKALEDRIESLVKRRKSLSSARVAARREIEESRLRLVNEFLPRDLDESLSAQDLKREDHVPFESGSLVFTESWECEKSPTGYCVYHPASDPGYLDNCIYCHDPLERK